MIALVVAERKPGMNPAELSRIETRLGIREILRHLVGYAYTVVRGLAITLVGPARSHFVERFQGSPAAALTGPLVIASALSAILMTLASAAGALVWLRARDWRRLLLIGLPLAYLLLIGAGPESWARFRVPLEPLLPIVYGARVGALSLATEAARGVLPDPTEALDESWRGAVHEVFAARQVAHVGAVLIHDRETLDPPVLRPRFGDVDAGDLEGASGA